jgi:hypothetical protein
MPPYLFAASLVALVFGFRTVNRAAKSCELEQAPHSVRTSLRISGAVLWVAAALWIASVAWTLYSLYPL